MTYETVEAIQVFLQDIGWILFPGTPEDPPKTITDEQVYGIEGLRIYSAPNPQGPSFYYDRRVFNSDWILRR